MYAIELIDVPAQPTAVLKGKIKLQEISSWMGSAFGQVWSFMTASGLVPTGPPFSRYLSIEGEFDLEAGFPVAHKPDAVYPVEASELPACLAAMTTHVGPYDTISEAYEALQKWAAENDYVPQGAFWESYLTDPGEEPDPAKWQTRVFLPVVHMP
jgi:effector-binding domain-containing protein